MRKFSRTVSSPIMISRFFIDIDDEHHQHPHLLTNTPSYPFFFSFSAAFLINLYCCCFCMNNIQPMLFLWVTVVIHHQQHHYHPSLLFSIFSNSLINIYPIHTLPPHSVLFSLEFTLAINSSLLDLRDPHPSIKNKIRTSSKRKRRNEHYSICGGIDNR